MRALIVDYEMGNLGSVKRSLEECGAEVIVSKDPKDLDSASHVVLPGVGAFHDGMANLKQYGWIPTLKKAAKDRIPILGICLGMQLLAEKGYEGGEMQGLGFIPGEVKRLTPKMPGERIPHVGWNEVHQTKTSPLFEGITSGTDFYFVHSYYFFPVNKNHAIATTPYCGNFTSAVATENIFGIQFHPEKSSKPGFQLLKNFLGF